MLSKDEIKSFKKIWREEFDEELSNDEVLQEVLRLLELVRFLWPPPSRDGPVPHASQENRKLKKVKLKNN